MWKIIPLCILQSALLTGGQVFLKFALMRMAPFGWNRAFWSSVFVNWQFAACGAFFLMASLLWMYIVKVFPFSMAYPLVSLSYVFGMLAAILFFHEEVPMTRWLGVLLIMAGCMLMPAGAKAQGKGDATIRQKILSMASQTKTLQCDFVQTRQLAMLSDKQVSRGKLFFAAPDRLRWEYVSPYANLLVMNGQEVMARDSRRSHVVDTRHNRMYREMTRLLVGSLSAQILLDDSQFSSSVVQSGQEWVATLTPRRKELRRLFSRIVIHFPVGQCVASKVELTESKGDHTLIEIQNAKSDQPIADKLFEIKK